MSLRRHFQATINLYFTIAGISANAYYSGWALICRCPGFKQSQAPHILKNFFQQVLIKVIEIAAIAAAGPIAWFVRRITLGANEGRTRVKAYQLASLLA